MSFFLKYFIYFFRGHEWCRHGTCAKDFDNEQEYFQQTINLYQRYSVTKILQEQGIIPSDVTMYEVSLVDYYLTYCSINS